VPTRNYQVQFKDNLRDALWQNLSALISLVGDEGTITIPADHPYRFYLIVETQAEQSPPNGSASLRSGVKQIENGGQPPQSKRFAQFTPIRAVAQSLDGSYFSTAVVRLQCNRRLNPSATYFLKKALVSQSGRYQSRN
jgi:hypothetical protein